MLVIFIFFLITVCVYCSLSKEGKINTLRGEDMGYEELKLSNKMYIPIQLGCFQLNSYSEEEFILIMNQMKDRVGRFVSKNWTNIDTNLFSEIENPDTIKNIDCSNIKVIQIYYHIGTRMIYILLNHARVGGGDYLVLGSVMFNGRTNSLLKEPSDSFGDQMKSKFAKYYCQYKLFSEVLLKRPIERYTKEQIIASKIDMNEFKSSDVKTKYILIHQILTNIMNSATSDVNKLVCWIPLGFEKSYNSPNNNVGIVIFTFVRDMTPKDVEQAIASNAIMSIGSRQLLIDSYDRVPKYTTIIEQIRIL